MACFLVPAAEAVITTAAASILRDRELKASVTASHGSTPQIPFSVKLGWLNKLLWGGSALLAFEHLWHGEIVPFFPFLTAIRSGETAGILAEMGSTGVLMAVFVTAVWGGMLAVSSVWEKRADLVAGPAGEGA